MTIKRSLSLVPRGLVWVCLLAALPVSAQIPSGYYNSANGLTGTALADALHNIIDDHTRYPYTSSSTDTWDVLSSADEDPQNTNNVLTIYKNASVPKNNTGSAWNREHSWPKSYGFRDDNSCNYPYTDMHHLFAADPNYNSRRSNLIFADCPGCQALDVLDSPLNNYYGGSGSSGSFQAWDGVKGDVARAMFYMAIRYEGGSHGQTGCSEPDLRLTNDRGQITTFSSNVSVAYMGLLSELLQWHAEDPVDAFERARNEIIYAAQGNRNPFIDVPEYAAAIWADGSNPGDPGGGDPGGGDPGGGDPGGGDPGGGDPPADPGDVWINEIHYDNSSTDTNEGVEIAGVAGSSLDGWQLVAYNGSNGTSYNTVSLSGSLGDEGNGFGTAWFAISGLQNGSPDGVALVDGSGSVVQFLGYEGTFTASNGPAAGTTSTNIGVSETSSTPAGYSLQLTGTGSSYTDFTWQAPAAHSRGTTNPGQTFVGGGGGTPAGDPWINEIHYDNSGSDNNEGVEIAGAAGTDLSGWQLVAYNGSNGTSYSTVSLSDSLSDEGSGFGTAWYAISGLQNGSPDGVALVDDNGDVVQFLSYEGSFTAANGPAAGIESTNIGVSEASSTPSGYSLQLTGTGSSYADFTWQAPAAHSRGTTNPGQTFTGGGSSAPAVNPWFNEIHYDNAGTDFNEGVEIAGPSGMSLDGWQVVAYNGSGGSAYKTIDLSGSLGGSGFGFAWIAVSGLQNGSSDGIALVDPDGNVVQFLSYEGSLTAADGPAASLTSDDIGVSESSSTSSSQSMQLIGSGSEYGDFSWSANRSANRGQENSGQSIF